jgi:hypothetical protein
MAWTNSTGAGFSMPGPLGHQQIGAKPSHPEVRGRRLTDLTVPGPLGKTTVASRERATSGPGATVWASHNMVKANWENTPTSGWSHLFLHMHGFRDICSRMKKEGLRNGVSHLAIVAHGNDDGQVLLDRPLTPETIGQFVEEFVELRDYLREDGMLTFYACVAGRGERGSQLLTKISEYLPSRTIVGFEVFGLLNIDNMNDRSVDPPGRVWGSSESQFFPGSHYPTLHPWFPSAKRAKDGKIIHLPANEQDRRPGRRCANPACPGHAKSTDSCPGF